MYKLTIKFKEGDKVLLTKSFQGFNEISLVNPTQAQLKHLFELGVGYVEKETKIKKDVQTK